MEFTIKQNVLKEELGYIQGVVEKKSTIPVLSNILIESLGEGSIRIVGTDLDVTIRCDAEADIKTPGAMCIQARKLFDIVRTLDGGDVHFKKEDNEWVRMKAGRANFRLAGVNREQYPEIPIFKSAPLRLSAEVFNYFIMNTSFAITTEQSRFTLSGAKFMLADGKARMVTTDGHRLAFVEKQLDETIDGSMDALIPKKALLELVKISRGFDGDVQFGEDQNHIYFETEGRLLITRKLTGNFPNYEMVMPKDNDKTVVFDLADMKAAVRRVSLMADERNRSIRMTVREGEVEVTAQSSEEGEGQEFVPADYKGDEVTLGFNWQYLQEFLNNAGVAENTLADTGVDTDEREDSASDGTNAGTVRAKESKTPTRISFEFKDGNAATQMRIAGEANYDYKYIVMPLRI
ncbi:MAG TPA: DNA polymerase III subunit beta [Pyrinomonadaceae bacterium]|nr:DNA polymerase III subunit beta [Chloracidobacterium sp.]HRJ89032.1 DNA polymerase III subunit beta [Pyrinomonadaceae bacterium]HRK49970.1 DNA polymerase III subunit beta [Pyrinomonadaceae bacterium]